MVEPSQIHGRALTLLELASVEKRPCKACGKMLYFVPNPKTGKNMPYTDELVNHFTDCEFRDQFRKKPNPA